MADVFSKRKRSQVMSRILGRGNRDTEVALAQLLRAAGITGWRRHQAIFGKPDFVFYHQRIALFVDGCFWHCCPVPRHSPVPKTRRAWWKAKLDRNKARDREVNRELKRSGWKVLRIWEHEIRHGCRVIKRILRALESCKS